MKKSNLLKDLADFCSLGVNSIYDDDFSKCFTPKRLEKNRPMIKYGWSVFYRYCIVMPLRFLIFLILGIFLTIFLFSCLFFSKFFSTKKQISFCFLLYAKLCLFLFGGKIRNHGEKPQINEPHIYVSNHTSILDYLVLSSYKFGHSCVVENHGGLFGFIFKHFLSKNGSLAFKRSQKNDRKKMLENLKKHIETDNSPMLLFPEGTCVNNDNTVMFQKGVFELKVKIFPVTIKYHKISFDPYWFRRKYSFIAHLLYLMSRSRFYVDVYYHKPVEIQNNESPSDFAERTKKIINLPVNFKNLRWSGYLKNSISLKDSRIIKQACLYTYCRLKQEKPLENDNSEYKYFGGFSYQKFMQTVSKNCMRILGGKIGFLISEDLNCSCRNLDN